MTYLKIKEYLEKNGIKQKWLANEIGVSVSQISLMLSGKAPIRTEMLFMICDKLGVSSETFRPDKHQRTG